MTRLKPSARWIPWAVGAALMGAAVGSLSRSTPSEAGGVSAPARRSATNPAPMAREADLVDVAARRGRVTLAEPPTNAPPAFGPAPTADVPCIRGTVIVPALFWGTAPVEVRAALMDGSLSAPVAVSADGSWELEGIQQGVTALLARAATEERLAVGTLIAAPGAIQAGTGGHVIRCVEYFVEVGVVDDVLRPLDDLRLDVSFEPARAISPWFEERVQLAEASVGKNGYLRLSLPGPGSVTHSAPAVDPFEKPLPVPPFLPGAVELEVSERQPSARGELMLMRAASLTGQLGTAGPAGKSISLFARHLGISQTFRANSSGAGAFTFEPLPHGRYRFYARHGGESGQAYSLTELLVLRPGKIHRVDGVLRNSSILTGVVVDTRGDPVSGATVRAVGSDNKNLKRSAVTDEFGLVRIAGLYGCEYVVTVDGYTRAKPVKVRVPPGGVLVDMGTWAAGVPSTSSPR